MRFIKICMVILLSVYVILYTRTQAYADYEYSKESADISAPSLFARAAVLMDGDTGRILYGKEQDMVLPMASTTKIMTCILALEYASPDDVVEVSDYAASMPDVQLNMRSGETYRMEDLLYSLMLESHNDTAAAIAEHVGGSVEIFAQMMNQKARELGCEQTYFITPNGLDAEYEEEGIVHSTTAADLARIMRYCITQSPMREEFLKITRTPSHAFSNVNQTRTFSCVNHNALLTAMEGALSGKTGFTSKAGYCYVGAVQKGEKMFIVALLACGWPPHKTYKWQDVRKLVAYGDQHYDYFEIRRNNLTLETVPVKDGVEDSVAVKVCDSEMSGLRVLKRTDESVTIKTSMAESLSAPVMEGDIAGQVEYKIGEETIAVYPIRTMNGVEIWNLEFCAKTLLKHFLFCYNE